MDFVLFGATHLLTLAVCTAVAIAAYRLGRSLRGTRGLQPAAAALAGMLIGLEILKAWQGYVVAGQPWQELLPLHLCRISSFLCSAMLIWRHYRLFEVAYFWGVGGSLAAMLTPDLQAGFPQFQFVGFFAGHTLVMAAVLYAISAFALRPQLSSIAVTAVVTAVYMVLVACINAALDTNYLYLSHKPQISTVYDYLGPWPWYIASVWAIGVAMAFLLYLPFAGFMRRQAS